MNIITSFEKIKQEIKNNLMQNEPNIIAVSKTFPMDHIKPLIDYGHKHFGENKVQEAEKKWGDLKKTMSDLKLHMVGRLQSNKVKKGEKLCFVLFNARFFSLLFSLLHPCTKFVYKKKSNLYNHAPFSVSNF